MKVFLASNRFFYVVLVIFAVQALWIAWSGAYSMAYDEFFHLAAIQEYAKHWLPIASESTTHPELGAFSRDVSFLYHYLMSFPYRLIIQVWHSFAAQMIVLRVIDVAMFLGGMVLFWRTLLRAGLTKRATNVIMLFFSLVPTFVMVAAQLNYDNMMFLVAGAVMYLSTDMILNLRQKRPVSLLKIMGLLSLLLAGSVVKYAFLPVAGTVGVVVLAEFILAFRRKTYSTKSLRSQLKNTKRALLVLMLVLFAGSAALFLQRIGGNVIRYHSPVPDCARVIDYEQCLQHDAYGRNANYVNLGFADRLSKKDKLTYPIKWYQKMLRESFFVVASKENGYKTGAPLEPSYTAGRIIALVLLLLMVVSAVWFLRSNPIWRLWFIVAVSYIGVLFLLNYKEYLRLGVPVAVHGRYAVPVIILIGALGAVALRRWMAKCQKMLPYVYTFVAVLVVMLVFGGGWLPWVIRSGDNWMWPHAVEATRVLRSLLWHVIWK